LPENFEASRRISRHCKRPLPLSCFAKCRFYIDMMQKIRKDCFTFAYQCKENQVSNNNSNMTAPPPITARRRRRRRRRRIRKRRRRRGRRKKEKEDEEEEE
jgi:hypothetical protein